MHFQCIVVQFWQIYANKLKRYLFYIVVYINCF